MALTPLAWLRKLVNDVPAMHHDLAIGDGATTAFQFSVGTPVDGSLVVTVEGTLMQPGVDYQLMTGNEGVIFGAAPADESQIRMAYLNSTWSDEELQAFLDAASQRWDSTVEMVPGIYQAALYALDTTLMGLAAALNFGAGAEQFDVASVFNRMLSLRNVWMAVISEQIDTTAAIAFVDVLLDLDDPNPSWVTDPIGPRWWFQ